MGGLAGGVGLGADLARLLARGLRLLLGGGGAGDGRLGLGGERAEALLEIGVGAADGLQLGAQRGEVGLEALGRLGAVHERVDALGERGVGAAQDVEALVGVEHEPLDALDRLGRDLLLAVAVLQRLARLGDLLGQPLLALLEQPPDLGDLVGKLGGHGRVHLRGLAAGLADLERELLLALLEGGAGLGELGLERRLARLEGAADLLDLRERVLGRAGGLLAGGPQRLDRGAQLLELAGLVVLGGQRGQLGARGGGLLAGGGGVGAQLLGEVAQGVEPLGGVGALALQLLEAAAVVAGQPLGLGLLDLDAGDLLAQALALAADLLDALQRGGELLAGGLALLLALALDALGQRVQLGAGGAGLFFTLALDALHERVHVGAGLAGLVFALGLQALDLGAQLLAGGLGGLLGRRAQLLARSRGLRGALLELLDPAGEVAAVGLGALVDGGQRGGKSLLGGLHGLGAGALGGLDLLGELEADGLGPLGGLGALVAVGGRIGQALLELPDALQQLGLLGDVGAAHALEALDAPLQRVLLGGVDDRGLLQARDALEQLGLLAGVGAGADLVAHALELLARLVDLALGGLGAVAAVLGLAAGLLERGGEVGGGLLEILDALERGEQARDDRGGVVEVGDRVARDPGIGIEHLLGLEVGGGAARLTRGELVVDPRGGLERAEGDERAGRAPAVPRLRLGLERPAQRTHHDRVLLAHAHQHQVARQLEGEVLEEEREVEALVELDRDEDHLERERPLVGRVERADVLLRAGARGLAALEEAAPRLGVGGRVVDERVEQALAQHLGGVEPEQQLGRLAPLGDRALAVGQDEEPVDDLGEERVERVVRDRGLGDLTVLRRCLLDGVHGRVRGRATPPGAQLPHGSPRPSPPRFGVPASW